MFIKTDQYGRDYIAAPTGKVLKGYIIYGECSIEHCLVDSYGMVFRSGKLTGGWTQLQHSDHSRVVVLPTPVERGNEFKDNSSWSWEDWYEKNWQCDSWAWMYCKEAKCTTRR